MENRASAIPLCDRCEGDSSRFVSQCYDASHRRICELWYCPACERAFAARLAPEIAAQHFDGRERRVDKRFSVNFVLEFMAAGRRTEPLVASVVNASSGGAYFFFPEPLDVGTEGQFRISLPSAPRSFEARGRIVRCVKTAENLHGIGVQFDQVDPQYKNHLERYVKVQGAATT